MLVFLAVSILFLAFLSLTFKTSATVKIDVLKNIGVVKIRLFGIKVFKLKFWSKDKPTDIEFAKSKKEKNNKKKKPEIHVTANKKDKFSVASIINSPLIANLRIPKMHATVFMGAKDDAFLTVMGYSLMRITMHSMFSFMRNKFNTVITQDLNPVFDQNRLDIVAETHAHISVGDVFVGLNILLLRKLRKLFKGIALKMRKRKVKKYEYNRATS